MKVSEGLPEAPGRASQGKDYSNATKKIARQENGFKITFFVAPDLGPSAIGKNDKAASKRAIAFCPHAGKIGTKTLAYTSAILSLRIFAFFRRNSCQPHRPVIINGTSLVAVQFGTGGRGYCGPRLPLIAPELLPRQSRRIVSPS